MLGFVAAAAAGKLHLNAGGASFPAAMYQDVTFAHSFRQSGSADFMYHPIGSSAGKRRIKAGGQECMEQTGQSVLGDHHSAHRGGPCFTLDWAASDSLLSESDYAAYPDLQMYPTMAGAVVPIFNLPGFAADDELVLTPLLVSRLFRGAVTMWDDAEIVSLNPHLTLPSRPIVLCVRSDASGTTEILKKSLSAFEPEFAWQVGADNNSSWGLANVTRRRLNIGVATFVAHTPYALGYSVLAEARAAGLPFAALLKGGVKKVTASAASVSYALAELGLEVASDVGTSSARLTANVHNALGLMAWPICGYTYLVMRKDPPPSEVSGSSLESRRATVDFWRWFYTDEDGVVAKLAEKNGFATLPPMVASKVLPQLESQIRWQGVLVASSKLKPALSVVGPAWLSSAFEQLSIIYEQVERNVDVNYTPLDSVTSELVSLNHSLATPAVRASAPAVAAAAVTSSALEDEMCEGDEVTRLPLAAVAIGMAHTLYPCTVDHRCVEGEPRKSDPPLVLEVSTIGWLCSGLIDSWDDPHLVSLNPWLAGVGAVPITLHAESSTSDTMIALREQLVALGELSESAEAFCPAATVQPSAAMVRSAVLHDAHSVGLLQVAMAVCGAELHGWASIAVCTPASPRPSPISSSVAAECRSGATPPTVAHLRGCMSRPPRTKTAREETEELSSCQVVAGRLQESEALSLSEQDGAVACYPLAVFVLLSVRSAFRGAECSGPEADSVPKQLARYLSWLYGMNRDASDGASEAPLQRAITRESMAFMGLDTDDAPLNRWMHELTRERLYRLTCDGRSMLRPDATGAAGSILTVAFMVFLGVFVVSLCFGLLACFRYRQKLKRRAANLKVSRDRAQLDLQLLTHQMKAARGQAPSGTPPASLPPAPPSSGRTPTDVEEGGGLGPGPGALSEMSGDLDAVLEEVIDNEMLDFLQQDYCAHEQLRQTSARHRDRAHASAAAVVVSAPPAAASTTTPLPAATTKPLPNPKRQRLQTGATVHASSAIVAAPAACTPHPPSPQDGRAAGKTLHIDCMPRAHQSNDEAFRTPSDRSPSPEATTTKDECAARCRTSSQLLAEAQAHRTSVSKMLGDDDEDQTRSTVSAGSSAPAPPTWHDLDAAAALSPTVGFEAPAQVAGLEGAPGQQSDDLCLMTSCPLRTGHPGPCAVVLPSAGAGPQLVAHAMPCTHAQQLVAHTMPCAHAQPCSSYAFFATPAVVANEAPPAVEAPAAVPRPTEPVSNDQWQKIVDYWKPYLERLRTGAEQPIQLRGAR